VTFAGVGGLDDVKKTVHRMIILPQMRPGIYERYGRQACGGILFYGPPGCGKTLMARATAGECHLPFYNIRIEDIVDPYFGISERNLHASFAEARAHSPCVLFLDEIDAIAYARRKQHASVGRGLVDQMLQEMDAIGSANQSVLIMAATNAPWDVDDALLRPGRFDRRIFVPPPDATARHAILKLLLARVPTGALDLAEVARGTAMFSGADLRALVERAVDLVIEEALESQAEPPVEMRHLQSAQAGLRPTTLDWLGRARNYVEFANQDERYEDIARYLNSTEVRGSAPSRWRAIFGRWREGGDRD
jgi:SpoVK/Ycf46/Vps4 family AAA+-type ATPase